MPEQESRRGAPQLPADLTAPVETAYFPMGAGGLDLNSAIDQVKLGAFTRLSNCYFSPGGEGELTGRPGQTVAATSGGTTLHSITRVDDPLTSTFTRMWGVDTSVMIGAAGALTAADTGYSGNPLTLLTYRPPLSGQPWVFVGDSARNRKIRSDGLVTEIGLPAPSVPAVAALGAAETTNIATFTAADGTGGVNWTPNAGTDFSTPPIIPSVPPVPGVDFLNGGTFFYTQPGSPALAAGQGYYQFWGLALTRNLSKTGSRDATDDDLIHLRIRLGNPSQTAEVRIYFVVSTPFTPSTLPGLPAGLGIANPDYYMKSFRPGDFSQFILGTQSQVSAAETARINFIRDQSTIAASPNRSVDGERRVSQVISDNANILPPGVTSSLTAVQVSTSADQEIELGIVGAPLRRGDFTRYGTTAGRDWSTVTGIIVYIQQVPMSASPSVNAVLKDCYLSGGFGLDDTDATFSPYDWRYTNYDPRTGAESNPSPIMDVTTFLDAARQQATVTPTAFGDGAVRQNFYRRGGSLPTDWYFEGVNDADGAAFDDVLTDLELVDADTLSIDNYQAVPTVDAAGNTVLAQPVAIFFGPVNGQIFALGDPYRPGYVYACAPGEPDHWPPGLALEVCPPSEVLMNGVSYGGQPFVFSRARGYSLYPNISGDAGMTSTPSGCTRGLAGRWAITVGAGAIWFAANDGVFRTTGGEESLVSGYLTPLFQGQAKNGYAPIDLSIEPALRLAVYRNELYFQYQDVDGSRQTMILQILTGAWRHYRFGQQPATLYSDAVGETAILLIGGVASGNAYTLDGFTDDGAAINSLLRTPAYDFGQPRPEKLLTDQYLDVDTGGVGLTLTNLLNNWGIANPSEMLMSATPGRQRAIFDGFGLQPQHCRNVSTEITWTGASTQPPPTLYGMGISHALQPDVTINRVTQWDDLGHPDQKYVTGITLDCDTGSTTRTLHVERDYAGVISDLAIIQVTTTGRHKLAFSWPGLPANQVRIRPDDECKDWMLFRADWIAVDEPPDIAAWDSYFENAWDQYYTGLDIYADTHGLTKTVEVYVDQALIGTYPVLANGRKVVHITLPWGRGHVFHFVATDQNPGILYMHRWHLQEEPSEQANLLENFSVTGTLADKWLKGILIEIDTFSVDKQLVIDIDGTVAAVTLPTTNTNGRQVVQYTFPQQRGRVFRLFSYDQVACRKYSMQWIFDEEPLGVTIWESQEIDHGIEGFQSIIDAQVTIRSSADVTLTMTIYTNQAGNAITQTYTIPSTGGVKLKQFVPFAAAKGVMFKYLFMSDQPYWLYREESQVTVQPWITGVPKLVQPFGNDDLTVPTRAMISAPIAASRSGGGA